MTQEQADRNRRAALHAIAMGAVMGFLSVAAGAFGAHSLRAFIAPELLPTWETGARYMMYHALAIIAAGILGTQFPVERLARTAWIFLAGIVLFSGSLFVLSVSGLRPLGIITPFGGAAMLAGWLDLARRTVRIARAQLSPHE